MSAPITMTFTAEEVETLKHSLNVACIFFGQRSRSHNDAQVREVNNEWSYQAGQLWSRVYRAEQSAKQPPAPSLHLVLCDCCQSEGRILTSNGGPDEEDHGECPACEGNGQLLVEGEPITIDDLDAMTGVKND